MDNLMSPDAPIEVVSSMGMDAVKLEKFMHEEVLIYVHPARDKESLEVIVPSVNGSNMPIKRGQEVRVKRKYIESLARCHSIQYEQRVQNPSIPEDIQMIEKKVPDYPFDVREDTKQGKDWLKRVYASI
jgi:hypothetical protein